VRTGGHQYWVYILASALGGTLYIGVTNDLVRRMTEHRLGIADGFTKRHRITRLVYFEEFGDIRDAIAREKQLKKWNRAWKIGLIEERNPNWSDLFSTIAPGAE
jgi:putative endonuclease